MLTYTISVPSANLLLQQKYKFNGLFFRIWLADTKKITLTILGSNKVWDDGQGVASAGSYVYHLQWQSVGVVFSLKTENHVVFNALSLHTTTSQ